MAKSQVKADPKPTPEFGNLWLAAQEEWKAQLPRPSYQAWLKNSTLLSFEGDDIVIGVPTKLAYEWIVDKYSDVIGETLERVIGRPVRITFEVCEWIDEAAAAISSENQADLLPLFDPDVPSASALMEYTLSRRAIWSPGAQRGDQLEYRYETEDIQGKFVIDYALGELTTAEMELVAWVLGRWDDRDGTAVTFSAREYVRAMGASWAGWRAKAIKTSIDRIHRTRFSGKVWDRNTKERKEKLFGIFDTVDLRDRADSLDAPNWGNGGSVTVRLSQFLVEQIKNKQFVRINWRVLRGGLTTPLARRLYVFLESQQGFGDSGNYSIHIDKKFMATLGSRDVETLHGSRFRKRLLAAGQEIVAHDPRYVGVEIRPSKTKRRLYVLEVRRDPTRVIAAS